MVNIGKTKSGVCELNGASDEYGKMVALGKLSLSSASFGGNKNCLPNTAAAK